MREAAMNEQLNTGFMDIPRAYFAKTDKHKKYSAANFTNARGRRLSANKIGMLAFINTERVMHGDYNRTSYNDFKCALGLCSGAICHNLKELKEDGFISSTAQSKYKIEPEFSGKENVRVYLFLLTEKIDLGGKIKRLSKNEALYLSEIIAFCKLNGNKVEPFIGGVARVAKTLNIPKSTAYDVIEELLSTKAIFSKKITKDSAGNYVIENGKGNSRACLTGYVLNSEILMKVKKIDKLNAETEELRNDRKLFNSKSNRKLAQSNDSAHDKYMLAAAPAHSDEKKAAAIERALKDNTDYRNLKRQYKEIKHNLFNAIKDNDEPAERELEQKFEAIRGKIYSLMRTVVPPDAIPKEFDRYI